MLSEFLKRLIFARLFDMNEGDIEILGLKQAMFPVNILKRMNRNEPQITYKIFKDGMLDDTKQYSLSSGLTGKGIIKNISNMF